MNELCPRSRPRPTKAGKGKKCEAGVTPLNARHGLFGWMRRNLFRGPFDTLVTLAMMGLVGYLALLYLDWGYPLGGLGSGQSPGVSGEKPERRLLGGGDRLV